MTPTIAVLGCGYWGRNLVRSFRELGVLSMVCDSAEAGRAAAKQIAPSANVVAGFEQALTNSEITAVAIAAPAALHYSLAKAALEAGKDVFVEKPLCLQVDQAQDLVKLAESLGR